MMPPALPTDALRAAIAAEDWPLATQLLEAHRRTLADALARADFTRESTAPWHELLATQRALRDELLEARERAAGALARFEQDLRGGRAWLRELA